MRTLTSSATSAKDATSAKPVNILKIEWSGTVGDKFYADYDLGDGDASSASNAKGQILSWGALDAVLEEGAENFQSDFTITLADPDRVLFSYVNEERLERRKVTIYQQFYGLAEADLITLLTGSVSSPVQWNEADRTLSFDIVDISALHTKTIGNLATRDDFPVIDSGAEDAILPIVFGKVERSEMAFVKAGCETELVKFINATDTTIWAKDAVGARFPQEQTIQIRIDNELITGSFSGNKFTATLRGAVKSNSTTTATLSEVAIVDNTLSGTPADFIGFDIKVDVTRYELVGGNWVPVVHTEYAPITGYDDQSKVLKFWPPFVTTEWNADVGRYILVFWLIPSGTAYSVASRAEKHQPGARITLVLNSYVYIANDAPSKAILRVEGFGTIRYTTWTYGQNVILDKEGYITIPSYLYTVNLNDTTTFPDLGRAVTTITFKGRPRQYDGRLKDDTLYVSMQGVESEGDGTGRLLENPSDIIKEILTRSVWGNLDVVADLKRSSFDSARDLTAWIKFGFTLDKERDMVELVTDLAFQACGVIWWEAGEAEIEYLAQDLPTAQKILYPSEIAEDSIRVWHSELSDVVTEISAKIKLRAEERTLIQKSQLAEDTYGRRVREIDLWAHRSRGLANGVAKFWLDRWRRVWNFAEISTFLTNLEIERGDFVKIEDARYPLLNGKRCKVIQVVHEPQNFAEGKPPTLKLKLWYFVPTGAGGDDGDEGGGDTGDTGDSGDCWLICEVTDIGDGCKTVCETGQETDDCTTICETACQVDCETGDQSGPCELTCELADEGSGGCDFAACETACQEFCEQSCTANQCEIECMTIENSGCTTSNCQVSAVSCVLTGCEFCDQAGNCQTGCTAGGSCQWGGVQPCVGETCGSCITACQASCTGACTSAETGCDTICETGCETQCETSNTIDECPECPEGVPFSSPLKWSMTVTGAPSGASNHKGTYTLLWQEYLGGICRWGGYNENNIYGQFWGKTDTGLWYAATVGSGTDGQLWESEASFNPLATFDCTSGGSGTPKWWWGVGHAYWGQTGTTTLAPYWKS